MHAHTLTRATTRSGTCYSGIGRVALVGAVLLLTTAAIAQPDRTTDTKPTDRAAQRDRVQREVAKRITDRRADAQPEAARLRARLATMLEQLETSAERLRGAIETLDAGGSMDEAITQLGGPMRARRLAEMWSQWERPGDSDRPMREGANGKPIQRGLGDGPSDRVRGPWGDRQVSLEEILVFLREHAPQLAGRLDALRKNDQHRADGFLARLGPRVNEIMTTRAHDPELAELLIRDFRVGMQVSEVGGAYARALAAGAGAGEGERAATLKEELRVLAAEQVDLRLGRREHEIARFVERLESLQAEVEEQRSLREQMIDEVVERAGQGRFRGQSGDRPGRGDPSQRPGRRERRNAPGDGE